MKVNLSNITGALLMGGFGIFCIYRFSETGLWYFALLSLRDFYASYLFLVRREGKASKSKLDISLAVISTIMPLCYLAPSTSYIEPAIRLGTNLLAVFGTVISTFATIELGKSLGVVAANRGLVKTGVYRILKHPMYTGYIIAEAGLLLINFTNTFIFLPSTALYLLRMKREDEIFHTDKI